VAVLWRDHTPAGELSVRARSERRAIATEGIVTKVDIREEVNRAAVEPLLPIEKKLIGWSLTVGVVLLVGLAILNHFIPATF
jgi:hypothetical protein